MSASHLNRLNIGRIVRGAG